MSPPIFDQPIEILLVEDNPGDARLVREALSQCTVPCHLNVVADGVQALAFLRRDAPYAEAPRPQLILLDLNLPGKSGHEVLREVKSDERLRTIPIIVLTTSRAPSDLKAAYDGRANCYLVKPSDLDEFFRTFCTMEEFWLRLVRLPH